MFTFPIARPKRSPNVNAAISKKQEKASAGSDAETKKLKAEVEELKGKLQLSAEEVAKLKSRCAAQSELLDQVLACLLFILSLRSTCTSREDKRIVV